MLSALNAECLLCRMYFMCFMLSVVILNVVIQSVVAPERGIVQAVPFNSAMLEDN
jgi:hypothetical protein